MPMARAKRIGFVPVAIGGEQDKVVQGGGVLFRVFGKDGDTSGATRSAFLDSDDLMPRLKLFVWLFAVYAVFAGRAVLDCGHSKLINWNVIAC